MGDWGLGIGDWGLGIGPNPQSPIPIPIPQSPSKLKKNNNELFNLFEKYLIDSQILIFIINVRQLFPLRKNV